MPLEDAFSKGSFFKQLCVTLMFHLRAMNKMVVAICVSINLSTYSICFTLLRYQ